MLAAALAVLTCLSIQEEQLDEARIRRLIEQLGADFLEERDSARKALEKAGAQAEGLLIGALSSGDHRVRRAALDLLGAFKSVKALPKAAAMLKLDEDPSVQEGAFRLIRLLGRDAESHLITALESPNPQYRMEAVQALAEFKSERCAVPMAELHDREQDKAIKEAAFKCLQSLGKPAEKFLLRHLASTDPALRGASLEGLRKVQTAEVLAAVGRLFAAENEEKVILDAAQYLKEAGAGAEPHFLAGLRSLQAPVRVKSIEGLAVLKSENGLDPVAAAFRLDESEEVREEAAKYLAGLGSKAEGALVEALDSPNAKVRLKSIERLGEIQSEKPLDRIAKLFHEDKDKDVHKKTFEYLKRLGLKAEKHLVSALNDEDRGLRREAIVVLGQARSEAAILKLIDIMAELDPDLRKAAEDALVRIGARAVEAVDRAVADGRVKKKTAELILGLYHQEEVERHLDRLVTDREGRGHFPGMFAELQKFGKERAVPALARIVSEPSYMPRLTERISKVQDYPVLLRDLAIMALGEMGDAASVGTLRTALAGVRKDFPSDRSDDTYTELVLALNRLGDAAPLEQMIVNSREGARKSLEGNAKEDGLRALLSLGRAFSRVGRLKESAEAYEQILKAVEEYKIKGALGGDVVPSTYYNLACLSARGGEKEKGVEWLEKAVRSGLRDRQWIEKDKDLDPLRGEERYRALLANAKLFEDPK